MKNNVEIPPVLVKNPEMPESARSYINIAPLFYGIGFIDSTLDNNPMNTLGVFLGTLGRIVATSVIEGGMIIDGYSKEEITYSLFQMEEWCKKCTIVNM